MSSSISFVSLNVEHSKHLDVIKGLLEKEKPDVFCAQEMFEYDIPFFETLVGPLVCFAPMVLFKNGNKSGIIGVGMFSTLPARAHHIEYYYGDKDHVLVYNDKTPALMSRPLVYTDLEKDGSLFRIGTTHFTWTPDGQADDAQRRDLKNLFAILDTAGDIAFAGDFNAPRGWEIFSALSERFKDNIPPQYDTSIEGNTQRNSIKRMVDGLFTTPAYEAYDVDMVSGVSDHYAIKARIRKGIV